MPLTPRTNRSLATEGRPRRMVGAALLAAVLLLNACGGDDDAEPEDEDAPAEPSDQDDAAAESDDGDSSTDEEEPSGDGSVTATFDGEPLSFDTVECAMRGFVFVVSAEGDDRVEFRFETEEDSDVAETLHAIMVIPDYDDELPDSQLDIYQVVENGIADLAEGGEAPQGEGSVELPVLPGTEADPPEGTLDFEFSC